LVASLMARAMEPGNIFFRLSSAGVFLRNQHDTRRVYMRLNYLTYRVNDIQNDSMHWMNLAPMLKAFCSIPDPKFRNSFVNGADRVLLLHQTDQLFLFIQTNNSKLIEQIDTEKHELKDLEALLGENDALGIAAYVYVAEQHVAYCAPSLAPRYPAFFRFINELFDRLKLDGYSVSFEPLLTQSSLKEVTTATHIARSTVVMEADTGFLKDLLGVGGKDISDFTSLDGIEITFRPKHGQSIKEIVTAALSRGGVRKANLRGKLEDADRMLDLYIESSGSISDQVSIEDKKRIHETIVSKISGNAVLQNKLKGLATNETITPLDDIVVHNLSDVDAWAGRIPNLLLAKPKVSGDPSADQ
jgi:hypothetical protein